MNNRGYRESALKQKLIGRRRQYQQLHEKHPGQYIILSPVRLTQLLQVYDNAEDILRSCSNPEQYLV